MPLINIEIIIVFQNYRFLIIFLVLRPDKLCDYPIGLFCLSYIIQLLLFAAFCFILYKMRKAESENAPC